MGMTRICERIYGATQNIIKNKMTFNVGKGGTRHSIAAFISCLVEVAVLAVFVTKHHLMLSWYFHVDI